MVELRWCGMVRVYIRTRPATGPVRLDALEVAVFAGQGKGSRLAYMQSFDGLKPMAAGYESAARGALIAMMKSTPRGIDLTGIAWPDEDIEEKNVVGELRDLVWRDLEELGKKGWDVA